MSSKDTVLMDVVIGTNGIRIILCDPTTHYRGVAHSIVEEIYYAHNGPQVQHATLFEHDKPGEEAKAWKHFGELCMLYAKHARAPRLSFALCETGKSSFSLCTAFINHDCHVQ